MRLTEVKQNLVQNCISNQSNNVKQISSFLFVFDFETDQLH